VGAASGPGCGAGRAGGAGAATGGADDYVTKPFSWHELAARIRAVLHRKRETGELPTATLETAPGPSPGTSSRHLCDAPVLVSSHARTFGRSFPMPGDSLPVGVSALTAAELRLLPMLSTHLSFPEIAEEMFLSRNTVKSHAASIYRKLGASSRSQAVARSRNLGLLDW
jgi:DNA-binding NarL/FixJ family response regulator